MTIVKQKNIANHDYYKILEKFKKRNGHSHMLPLYTIGIIKAIINENCTDEYKIKAIEEVVNALEKV